jgi:two-component system, NarL family, nitrate/nitrite response regulator NarL
MTSPSPPPIRQALIVEDDPTFLRAIRETLGRMQTPWQTYGCGTGGEALAYCREPYARLDLALVDLGLPDIGGVAVIRAVRARFPEIPILVISVVASDASVLDAIRAGAVGYLLKGDASLSMARAIDLVLQGSYPISPSLARCLFMLAGHAPDARSAELPDLTPRESELLRLIAAGHSYAEAAQCMDISLSTVQAHIRSLYRKLEVHSQTQAISKAREEGLL